MPIKFRCHECRQFLGISRARAGQIVDCPTCGRTIRVPELDGTVKPLPEPGLKFDDTRLKNALDEIAMIGDRPAADHRQQDAASEMKAPRKETRSASDDGAEQDRPQTLDEPDAINLPPLPQSEPVAPDPLPQREIDFGDLADDDVLSDDSSVEDRPWRSTAQPRDSWKQLIAAAALRNQKEWDAAVKAEQEAERPDDPDDDGPSPPDAASDETGQESEPEIGLPAEADDVSLGFSTLFAIVGLIVLVCSAGFWIGRSTAIRWRGDTGNQEGSEVPLTAISPAAGNLDSGLEGRITWKSESGLWKADRDACVLALPVNRDGVSRVSFAGLSRGDSEEDRRVVVSSLRAMGGAVAFAGDDGRFHLPLDDPGDYYVLILSRSVGRSESPSDDAVVDTLSRYFERAAQVLGHLAYRFERIRYSGQGTVPLDTGFVSP